MYQKMDFDVGNDQRSETVAQCMPGKPYREGIKKTKKAWRLTKKTKWQNVILGEQAVE